MSNFTKKLMLIPFLLIIACIYAGTYGAIHNQISYTVSLEYFTKFKYLQFGVSSASHRLNVAVIE